MTKARAEEILLDILSDDKVEIVELLCNWFTIDELQGFIAFVESEH